MNILIITSLYPEHNKATIMETSFAIHELALGLHNYGVNLKKVIRPSFEDEWRNLKFYPKFFRREIIDGIVVESKSFFNFYQFGSIVRRNDVNYIKDSIKNIDLIVAHMPEDIKLARDIYKKFGLPFIAVLHESDILLLERQKNIIKYAQNVYGRSWAIKRILEENDIKVDGIVYSGIDEKLIVKNKKFNKSDTLKIITVSIFQKKKNIDIVLKALAKLPKDYKWEYTIIGKGELNDYLKDLIKVLNLEDKVKMLGFQTRDFCLEEMKNSDIFVMPSYPETFGLVYLEAMASGCIVICSKGWGIDGIIENGTNGYLVTPYEIDELTNIFENILNTPQDKILKKSLNDIRKYTNENAQKNYADIIKKNMNNGILK